MRKYLPLMLSTLHRKLLKTEYTAKMSERSLIFFEKAQDAIFVDCFKKYISVIDIMRGL